MFRRILHWADIWDELSPGRTEVLFRAGRWLLLTIAVMEAVFGYFGWRPDATDWPVLAGLIGYLGVVAVWAHQRPLRPLPVLCLLAVDLLSVTLAADLLDVPRSPLLVLFYPIIFLAAAIFGMAGGVLASLAASVLTVHIAQATPGSIEETLRHVMPFLMLAGPVTGLLAERSKMWAEQYRTMLKDTQDRQVLEEVARHELDLACSMQMAALPGAPPCLPGLQIAARYEFAQAVGGDFYLFLPNGDSMDLVLGDVSGHGLPAALAATSITHLLPWLHRLNDPSGVLRHLNRDLQERLPVDAFATMVMAEVDLEAGTARLWNAGHPPALVWRSAQRAVHESTVFNPLLGMIPEWAWEAETVELHPGDVLLLYSDGLTETRNAEGDMFEDAVVHVLAENAHKDAEGIADALVAAAHAWGPSTDDLTLMVCKRAP